jgi:hypothetical protein
MESGISPGRAADLIDWLSKAKVTSEYYKNTLNDYIEEQ